LAAFVGSQLEHGSQERTLQERFASGPHIVFKWTSASAFFLVKFDFEVGTTLSFDVNSTWLPRPHRMLPFCKPACPEQLLTEHSTSVPTQNDILIPETLLKKRKSQERAREDRAIATKEKRGTILFRDMDEDKGDCDDYNYQHRLDYGQCCRLLTIFRE
jgi:hypothetical protein